MALDAAGSLLECIIGASMKLIYLMLSCYHSISPRQRYCSHNGYLSLRNDEIRWQLHCSFARLIRRFTILPSGESKHTEVYIQY